MKNFSNIGKKNWIFLILFSAFSLSVKAQKWVLIGVNENGQSTYLDQNSIKSLSNNLKIAWTKFDLKNKKYYENGKYRIIPNLIYTTLSKYDCANNTITDLKLIVKEPNGKILFNEERKESEQQLLYIPEEALARSILKFLCK